MTATAQTYEVMFLLGQAAAADFGGAIEHINEVLSRAGAEVLAMKKWDERRLAYEIDKQKRGVYILTYITCEPGAASKIERDVQISDRLMRVLVTRADHLTEEEIQANDDRDGLVSEAKMRAERGDREEAKTSGVRLGAPEQETAKAEDEASEGPKSDESADSSEGDESSDES